MRYRFGKDSHVRWIRCGELVFTAKELIVLGRKVNDGLCYKEIAHASNKSPGTIVKLLNNARRRNSDGPDDFIPISYLAAKAEVLGLLHPQFLIWLQDDFRE